MSDLLFYFAFFWAIGIILMGFYIRHKYNKRTKNTTIQKLIIFWFTLQFPGSFLYSTEETVDQSAYTLLNLSRSSHELHHPSALVRDVLHYGNVLENHVKESLLQNGYTFTLPNKQTVPVDRNPSLGLDEYVDTDVFRFHFTTQGQRAVDPTDNNGNSIPDYVDTVIFVFDDVYRHITEVLGYTPPPSDDILPASMDNGGSSHYDVYINNLSSGFYGYVQADYYVEDNPNSPDITEINAYTSYMAIRNNYDGFTNSQFNNLRVTIAHEFFHSIQFGYDGWEVDWVMEATSVWMEESAYDDINDCYQYLLPWFEEPHESLAATNSRWYGSFIYFQYIDEHLGGPDMIRQIWNNSILHDSWNEDDSRTIIDDALSIASSSFIDAFISMAIANRILSTSAKAGDYSYDEADAYIAFDEASHDPGDFPRVYSTVNFRAGDVDSVSSTNLERYGTNYIFLDSNDPVSVSLNAYLGSKSDYSLSAILRDNQGSYKIKEGSTINIDPESNGYTWMYLVVSSISESRISYHYSLEITDGEVQVEEPPKVEISRVYPNPVYSTHSDFIIEIQSYRTDIYTVHILDLLGRKISTPFSGIINEDESFNVKWNRKNTDGNRVASGVYFIQVKSYQEESFSRVVVIN